MSIPKTLGIETEYGIVHRGTDEPNPITASSLLINAFLAAEGYRPDTRSDVIAWDFIDEHPDMDARGFSPMGAMAPEVETQLVNAVLRNGARYYVDHAHPEMSTPECRRPAQRRALRPSRRADHPALDGGRQRAPAARTGARALQEQLRRQGQLLRHHENYLVSRDTPFGEIVRHCTAHFITRQMFTGAGKVGAELPGQRTDDVHYQLTQRADFFEEEVGLETTLKRPIINTRDEPHADARKYRRLHVIVGDANPSQVATFLKIGTTALVLALVEDGAIPTEFIFKAPVASLRHVSHDLSLSERFPLADGTTITALEVQWELFDLVRKHVDDRRARGAGRGVGGRGAASLGVGACRPRTRPDGSSLINSTGSRSTASSRGTGAPWALVVRRARFGRWTFSTPTCGPIAGLPGGSVSNNWCSDDDAAHRSRPARRHPRLLPRALRARLPRRRRGRQLGLDRVRRRSGRTSPRAHDGADARDEAPRGYLVR